MNEIRNKMLQHLVDPLGNQFTVDDFRFLERCSVDELIQEYESTFGMITFVYGLAAQEEFPEIAKMCSPAIQKFVDHPDFHKLLCEIVNGHQIHKAMIAGNIIPFCRDMNQVSRVCENVVLWVMCEGRPIELPNVHQFVLHSTSRIKYGRELLTGSVSKLLFYPLEGVYHDLENFNKT